MSPRRGSTPRLTDRLTVGRNATLTLTLMILSFQDLSMGKTNKNVLRNFSMKMDVTINDLANGVEIKSGQ
jgi:hypothetical protein